MGHRLCTVLVIVPCLLLAGLASPDALAVSGVASAAPARSAIKVTVDWPHAPVHSRTVTVHVTRAHDRPTIARLCRLTQMPTSLFPSAVPPKNALTRPDFVWAIVVAWTEGNGACS